MSDDVYVDLAYQGIELGTRLCMQEFTESEAYVQCPRPMPVGSAIVVLVGDGLEIPVRVARVNEQVAGAERPSGMFVGSDALEGSARDWWMARAKDSPAPQASAEGAPAEVEVANTEPTQAPSPVEARGEESAEASTEASAEEQTSKPTKSSRKEKAANDDSAADEEQTQAKKKRRRRKKKS